MLAQWALESFWGSRPGRRGWESRCHLPLDLHDTSSEWVVMNSASSLSSALLFICTCIHTCMHRHIHTYIYTYMHSDTVHVTSYLRNFADLPRRFSADLRSAKCGCPWAFRGIIAGYPWNYRWLSAESSLNICGTSVGHPRNVPLKVCAERSKEMD